MIQKAVMRKFTLNRNFKIDSLAVVGNSLARETRTFYLALIPFKWPVSVIT